MGKIILHVGPHKTGSTYIQKYLYLNREVLSEHGWVYPEPIELNPTIGHYGHIKLGIDETQISYYLNHYQGKRIIFSSENLYTLENEQIGRLFKSIFDAGFEEIVVVFYARHPVERLYSMIKELIKGGWYYTIPEFLSIYLLKPFTRKEVNYTIFLDTIKKFSSKIVIVDYEHFSKTSLLFPLLELMGIPPDRLNLTNDIINQGIKIEFVEILRWLNLKFANSGINPSGYKVFSIVRQVLLTNSKLKEKLTILQNALSQYKKSITVGSFISSSLESLLLKKYFNNFYKGAHESWDREVVIDYISEEWVLNKYLLEILDELYESSVNFDRIRINILKTIYDGKSRKIVYAAVRNTNKEIYEIKPTNLNIETIYIKERKDWNLLCIVPVEISQIQLIVRYKDNSEDTVELKL